MATGLQKSFNWGAVGLAAIGGAIGGGLGPNGFTGSNGAFSESLGEFGSAVARGVVGSAAGQGIGVATGLQSHFDWTGVAAAGIGAGAFQQVGIGLRGSGLSASATRGVAGLAGDIANAAARSLIGGTDFGDNITAALPDTIGQTVGNMMAGEGAARAEVRKTPMEIMRERVEQWEENLKNHLVDSLNVELPSLSWIGDSESAPGFVIGQINGTASGRTSEASFTFDNKRFVVYGASSMKQAVSIRDDLADIFSTPRGEEMFASLQKREGAIFGIDLTQPGVANADRQGFSNLIHIDPSFHPIIATTRGPVAASTIRVLAHELGHAAFGPLDDGENSMRNVIQNENPVMRALGYAARTQYASPGVLGGPDVPRSVSTSKALSGGR